jgi:translation initiation factor 2 beta subunit (eIF-2beta)/eIF-5
MKSLNEKYENELKKTNQQFKACKGSEKIAKTILKGQKVHDRLYGLKKSNYRVPNKESAKK